MKVKSIVFEPTNNNCRLYNNFVKIVRLLTPAVTLRIADYYICTNTIRLQNVVNNIFQKVGAAVLSRVKFAGFLNLLYSPNKSTTRRVVPRDYQPRIIIIRGVANK